MIRLHKCLTPICHVFSSYGPVLSCSQQKPKYVPENCERKENEVDRENQTCKVSPCVEAEFEFAAPGSIFTGEKCLIGRRATT